MAVVFFRGCIDTRKETYTINDIRALEDLFGFAVSDATQGRPARDGVRRVWGALRSAKGVRLPNSTLLDLPARGGAASAAPASSNKNKNRKREIKERTIIARLLPRGLTSFDLQVLL